MKRLFSMLLLLPAIATWAQDDDPMSYANNIIHQSGMRWTNAPEVAALNKFGNYPVDHSTGIPDITIPIYTLVCGDIEIPIGISYHMGGNRVDERESSVGLGWSLRATGNISRTIRGLADDNAVYSRKTGFLTEPASRTPTLRDGSTVMSRIPYPESILNQMRDHLGGDASVDIGMYLESVLEGEWDGLSDIYNYNIPGKGSGGFFYNMDRNLIQTPLTDNKITRDSRGNYTIIGDTGIQYKFFVEHTDSVYNFTYGQTMSNVIRTNTGKNNWWLSEIISADYTDTVRFTYTARAAYKVESINHTIHDGERWVIDPSYPVDDNYGRKQPFLEQNILRDTYLEYHSRLISSIRTSSTEVIFSYSGNSSTGIRQLTGVTVSSTLSGRQLRRAVMEYKSWESQTGVNANAVDYRSLLTSVQLTGSSGSYPEVYTFQYNENIKLPPYYVYKRDLTNGTSLNNNLFLGQDYWGYYNGETGNKTRIPEKDVVRVKNMASYNGEPSERHMKAGILTRINYPTGGYTEFITEAHRYGSNPEKMMGGLRIAEMRSDPGMSTGQITVTKYHYEDPQPLFLPEQHQYKYIMYSNPWARNAYIQGDYVDINGTYYTVFTDTPLSPVGFYNGAPITYGKVTKTDEILTDTGQATTAGKSVFYYTHSAFHSQLNDNTYWTQGDNRTNFTRQIIPWYTAMIQKEEYYSTLSGSDTFTKVKEKEYTYYPRQILGEVSGMMVYHFCSYESVRKFNTGTPSGQSAKPFYDILFHTIETGSCKVRSLTEREYGNNGAYTEKVTNYQYEKAYLTDKSKLKHYVTTKTVGDKYNPSIFTHKYYYPDDYNTAPYTTMVTRNMVSIPVEEVVTRSNREISRIRVNYKSFGEYTATGTKYIKPYTVQTSNSGIPGLRVTQTMDYYDKYGNIAQSTDMQDTKTTYLWGYRGKYPVAEIKNATLQEVIAKLGLEFIKNLADRAEPSLFDLGYINSLREELPGAQVSTFTFHDAVGIATSATPAGLRSYYDYDPFSRLKRVSHEVGVAKTPKELYHYNVKSMGLPVANNEGYNTSYMNLEGADEFTVTLPNLPQYPYMSTATITPVVNGGSGSFTYRWTLSNGSQSTNRVFSHHCTKSGSHTLTLVVTDQYTRKSKTVTTTLVVGSDEFTLTIANLPDFNYMATATVTPDIRGGSGYFNYRWTLSNGYQSTSPVFSYLCDRAGNFTLTLVVTDQYSGKSKTVSKPFVVVGKQPITFNNRSTTSEKNIYNNYCILDANIDLLAEATITFEMRFEAGERPSQGLRSSFTFAGHIWECDYDCLRRSNNRTVHTGTVTLRAGRHNCSIGLYSNDPDEQECYLSIKIISVESTLHSVAGDELYFIF